MNDKPLPLPEPPPWPKHPDGRPMKFGELTPEQKREHTTRAVKRLRREMESPEFRAALSKVLE